MPRSKKRPLRRPPLIKSGETIPMSTWELKTGNQVAADVIAAKSALGLGRAHGVDRTSTHGKFPDVAGIAQRTKNVWMSSLNWDRMSNTKREALILTAHKIARILSGDCENREHWLDGAGYLDLGAVDCALPDAVGADGPEYIGHGHPPKHSQFKPGQSGNPRGRRPRDIIESSATRDGRLIITVQSPKPLKRARTKKK